MQDKFALYRNNPNYVFHGSDRLVNELVPNQPKTLENGVPVDHGDPCVAATPHLEIAIFRALYRVGGQSGFSRNGNELEFRADLGVLDVARKRNQGYVYVLNADTFRPFTPMEVRSASTVKPVEIIEVNLSDFSEKIKLISSN